LIALFRAAPEEDAEEEEEDDMVVGQAVEISNRNTTQTQFEMLKAWNLVKVANKILSYRRFFKLQSV
jgi:hypothetical protein